MSGRSRSRGRSSSPRRASAASPGATDSSAVQFIEKGKENNRVTFLVSMAGAEPEWILRTDLIDMGHKSAMLRWEREQKNSGSAASSSRKKSSSRGRSASRSASKSRSKSTKKARGASPSPKRGRSRTPTRRAAAAGGSSAKKAKSPSKRAASPKRSSTPKRASTPKAAKSATKSAQKPRSSTPPRSTKKSAAKAPPKTATPKRRSRSVSRKTPTPQKAPKAARAKDFAGGMRAASDIPAPAAPPSTPFSTFVLPEDAHLGSAQLVASAKQLIAAPLAMARNVLGGVALLHVDNEYVPECVVSEWQALKATLLPLPWFELVVFLVVIGVLQGLRRHQAAVAHTEYTRLTVLAALVLGVMSSSFSTGLPSALTNWAALGVALALFVANRVLLVARTSDDNSYMPKKAFAPLHIEAAALAAMAVALSVCSQVPGLGSLTTFAVPETVSQAVATAAPLVSLAAFGNAVTATVLSPTSRGVARVAGVLAVCVVLNTCNVCALSSLRELQVALGSVYIKTLMDAAVRLPSQWLVAAGVWMLGYSCKA